MKADLIGEPYPTDDESNGPDAVPVDGPSGKSSTGYL
jgi:hypothetical protein